MQEDTTSERGIRNVIDGETELLFGFEFNIWRTLGTRLFAPFMFTTDRVASTLDADLASFVPLTMIIAPSGTTHFNMVSGGAEVDFKTTLLKEWTPTKHYN